VPLPSSDESGASGAVPAADEPTSARVKADVKRPPGAAVAAGSTGAITEDEFTTRTCRSPVSS